MDLLRRMLRGLIIFLVGAGLLAAIYTTRPDVPVGSPTSRPEQPATPARLSSTATTPIPTGPASNAVLADAVEPISSDFDKAMIRREAAKRFSADEPRAELAREPRSVGWGDSYAVRLLTASGRPMIASHIVLIAHMADGTVQNVSMGALPERGVSRATVATRRSAPISLRVRVSYGEQWVEIALSR